MVQRGALQINVQRGEFEKDADLIGKMDPYVTLACGESEFATRVAENQGKTPVWNEVHTFYINDEKSLQIKAYDKDLKSSKLLGEDIISLEQVRQQKSVLLVCPVYEPKKRQQTGKIFLQMQFTPYNEQTGRYGM